MNIVVSLREKWGKKLFYPVSDDAVFLAEFTGRPTLLRNQLLLAVKRGWDVHIMREQYSLENLKKQ